MHAHQNHVLETDSLYPCIHLHLCIQLHQRVCFTHAGEWKNFKALPGWPDKDAQLFLIAFTLTLLQVGGGQGSRVRISSD